jgi:hypothetical protein
MTYIAGLAGRPGFAESLEMQQGFPAKASCEGQMCCEERFSGVLEKETVTYTCKRHSSSWSSAGVFGLSHQVFSDGKEPCQCKIRAVGTGPSFDDFRDEWSALTRSGNASVANIDDLIERVKQAESNFVKGHPSSTHFRLNGAVSMQLQNLVKEMTNHRATLEG